MSGPSSAFHRRGHFKIPLSLGMPGSESKDFAKLRDSGIQMAGITECLPQTQVGLGQIRPYGKRVSILGDRRVTIASCLQ
jgi:hypothetical protein